MKKSVLAIMVGALCIILSSCQETPEESSVVSKVDGISEAAVCEPLKKGEKRETNVPTHWKFEEKKSNDRVVIQADIKLAEQSIGNLPVIEMQNHELTQEELNGLIDYFTDGEELYMPQMVTKDAYQEVLDRISSKEGSYLQSAYSTSIAGIQNATREGMELAPDEASAPEKMEIKFQKKTEDHGVEAARSWMSTELENTDTEDYFTADVGEDRKAYIEAERYNQEIDNDSSFLWMEGSNFIEEETIETEEMQSEYYSSFGMDTNGYTEKFHELADAYRKCMDKITFTEEDGKEQAEQVLEDLGRDMVFEVKNLVFGYEPGHPILNGISLCVKKGERIAIVGENGSGKSTLLNLLAGFYRPQKGIIKLYGAPVELMDIQDMRNRIAVISQRPYLFQGTIEENVNIDGKASRDAVVEACRKSGALGFIEKLDHGFGQKIGQDGAKLSGGERQKIAVARALLKNADILLMDEATEGFDVESNEALRELLHSELKNKTIVFITHKYKELESVDKVYRLSKGILELVRS